MCNDKGHCLHAATFYAWRARNSIIQDVPLIAFTKIGMQSGASTATYPRIRLTISKAQATGLVTCRAFKASGGCCTVNAGTSSLKMPAFSRAISCSQQRRSVSAGTQSVLRGLAVSACWPRLLSQQADGLWHLPPGFHSMCNVLTKIKQTRVLGVHPEIKHNERTGKHQYLASKCACTQGSTERIVFMHVWVQLIACIEVSLNLNY